MASGRDTGLAGRYAKALYDLADERQSLDRVAGDLRSFRGMLDESDDLRRLVRSPIVKRDEQVAALGALAGKAEFSDLTTNFLKLVARNRRLFAIRDMIDAYLATLAERRGEVTAHVQTAHELSSEQTERLTDALRRSLGDKVTIDPMVDPSLLGGMIVRVGSRMFDSSLKTKLQRLEHAMKGVG